MHIMKKSIIFTVITFAITVSCDDGNYSEISVETNELLTTDQQNQIKTMKETQIVLGNIIQDLEVRRDILSEVKLKYDGDNNARFTELLNLSHARNGRSNSAFANAFLNEVENANNVRSDDKFTDLVEKIQNEDLVIYAPYYEEFDWDTVENVTVTFHPLVNEDVNQGIAHEFSTNISNEVIVDDEYAFTHPTIIIKPADGEERESNNTDEESGNPNGRSAISTHQLSVGWMKSTVQHDGLFAGGPDFKFAIIGGAVTSLNEATGFSNITSVNLSRRAVRKKQWKKFYYELDDDWVSPEDSRHFGLIEYDKRKKKRELKFSAKVKIGKLVETAAEHKVTIEAEESWIKTDVYASRTKFKASNRTNYGHGTKDGYRVYKNGDVSWTLPLRKFSY